MSVRGRPLEFRLGNEVASFLARSSAIAGQEWDVCVCVCMLVCVSAMQDICDIGIWDSRSITRGLNPHTEHTCTLLTFISI